MAGRKLTKYEKMWRTRRHNAKLAAQEASASHERSDMGRVRTSRKRLKPNAALTQAYNMSAKAIGQALYGDQAGSKAAAPPESFVVVTDSLGRGVMVNVRDVLRAAEVIKQTGYVE